MVKRSQRKLKGFSPKGQPESLKAVWRHFKNLGVSADNFGQSKPHGEITIRTEVDTAYVTEMKRKGTIRVTLHGDAPDVNKRRKMAIEYSDESEAIRAVEKALGF